MSVLGKRDERQRVEMEGREIKKKGRKGAKGEIRIIQATKNELVRGMGNQGKDERKGESEKGDESKIMTYK